MNNILRTLSMLMATSAFAVAANITPGDQKAALVKYPADLTYEKLYQESFPRVFVTAEDIAGRRAELPTSKSLQSFLKSRDSVASVVVNMSDDELRAIIPPDGQLVVYGLGMSLDPDGVNLRWAGYQNPRCVIGKDNKVYPDEEHPDDGEGWTAADGTKCYFRCRAAGFAYDWIEKELSALADCYALTGDEKYAHAAAVLMDGVAWSYKDDVRGPLDYPIAEGDELRGGRLNRPYYQTARALMIYVWCFDSTFKSGAFGEKSAYMENATIFDNVARNLMFNGAIYCLGFSLDGTYLHNGHADYLRGNAAVGLALGIPELAEPLWDDRFGLRTMMNVSVDRDGFYVESSHMYSLHLISLLESMADFQESGVKLNMNGAFSVYDSPEFFGLAFRYFDKGEVGGRLPLTGDSGPDRGISQPTDTRAQDSKHRSLDASMSSQLQNVWWLLCRVNNEKNKQLCREFLRNAYKEELIVPNDFSILLKLPAEELEKIAAIEPNPEYFNSDSVMYGGKGLAILRGGKPGQTHGLQLQLGALHNHSQFECLSWVFMNQGVEWSYDPGYYNTHYRFGWTTESVSHQHMTIDAKSTDAKGGGSLLAWQPEGSAKYVYARHDSGYFCDQPDRFERMLAQADAPDGSLDYWLDIGIAEGGKFRDDSFHTVMGNVDTGIKFEPMDTFALGGDRFKGQHFLPDLRLSGETDKEFYWRPDGYGYGLLVEPAKYVTNDSLRMKFTKAIYENQAKLKQEIVVDFPGEEGREYYLGRSMQVYNSDSVPYIIRRDSNELSVFAKVIHFKDEDADNIRVKSVRALDVTPAKAGVKAYEIVLADGRRDCWFIGDGNARYSFSFADANVESDAVVEVWRLDANGKLFEHRYSGKGIEGTVKDVKVVDGKIRMTVDWNDDKVFLPRFQGNVAAVTKGDGDPANWSVESMPADDVLVISGTKTDIGRVQFTALEGDEGLHTIRPDSSFLFGRGGDLDIAEIRGRGIVADNGDVVAKGVDFGKKTNELTVLKLDRAVEQNFYRISEVIPGDKVRLLLNR